MDQNNVIECAGFYFIHNFDSGNLGHVERVPTELIAPSIINTKTNATELPDYEFNLWTRPDCAGTEFENGNRTWFYFGIQASEPSMLVRLNLINLNKQGKMYNQGMAPVTRTLPGKPQWERIRDRPVHATDENTFTLSFKYRTPENVKSTTFFAFTYPFSFAELQIALNSIDLKMLPLPPPQIPDDIYYCRECLVYSLEGRRVDLLTISSHHGITMEREDRLRNLFPDNQERPFKFQNKKVIFVSARVHPGETPSSFVFNGFLNLLLTRHDPIAIQLRKFYVFKMIPFLNPDGVARGHYRTDTRGVNLNRVYLNPSLVLHPTVYASRAIIRYHHFGCEMDDIGDDGISYTSRSIQNISESAEYLLESKKKKSPNASFSSRAESSRDKKPSRPVTGTKSTTTLKQPSDIAKKEPKTLVGDAANLAAQVCDLSLREMPSQSASDLTAKISNPTLAESRSLLNDDVLRSCLGSNVHVSTSEELNIQGSNPLRSLRETLKNSISLLMESSTGDSSVGGGSRPTNVKMDWCKECRHAVTQLETTMPGITGMVPGYIPTAPITQASNPSYKSIDEYREHQLKQFDEQERKALAEEQDASAPVVYFCTNCFKRYIVTDDNDEIKLCCTVSAESVAVSAGDNGDVRGEPAPERATLTVGDSATPVEKPPREEIKVKSAGHAKKTAPKKPAPPSSSSGIGKLYKETESGLYLYIDLHGHASKKGIFMYGNHFEDVESSVECMLLPRIMSLNNLHFHFSSCNFTERNMYLKDRRDGMSREGSGRVAVLKATGLVRSYTLECNYNTGRLVNILPPTLREGPGALPGLIGTAPAPPKYTPHIFEEVGRSLGASILDLTGQHPNSRIPCSEHRNLTAVRDWLRAHSRALRPMKWNARVTAQPTEFQMAASRLRPKSSPTRAPLYQRSKGKVTDERKENTYVGAKTDSERKRTPPILSQRSGHDMVMNMKVVRKPEPVKMPSRYLADTEPKPKSLAANKRRNVLAIRKPNASKTQIGVKAKVSRRSADDTESPRTSSLTSKLSKRSFSRSIRGSTRSNRCKTMASSSSDDVVGGNWEEVAGGTVLGSQGGLSHAESLSMASKRRTYPNPAPAHLKKIRLKPGL